MKRPQWSICEEIALKRLRSHSTSVCEEIGLEHHVCKVIAKECDSTRVSVKRQDYSVCEETASECLQRDDPRV